MMPPDIYIYKKFFHRPAWAARIKDMTYLSVRDEQEEDGLKTTTTMRCFGKLASFVEISSRTPSPFRQSRPPKTAVITFPVQRVGFERALGLNGWSPVLKPYANVVSLFGPERCRGVEQATLARFAFDVHS